MATTVARQIKEDFPDCHLTWAISYKCKQAIENNPFVDSIWSVEHSPDALLYSDLWYQTKRDAESRRLKGEFDLIYYTQIFPENFNNFDGTTRSSIFRSYPREITVPVQPVMRLRPDEVERVSRFAAERGLHKYAHVILFECAPASNQSQLSADLAIRLANRVVAERADTAFIISSRHSFDSQQPAVIDGSSLSYRENAEISKHCTLLLGCSSGITWLLTSDWAKKLPTIQFLSPDPPWYAFASVSYDHRFFGLDTGHILETTLTGEVEMTAMVTRYLAQGTFNGLSCAELVPSIEQIYRLYVTMHGRIAARRALRNFVGRNPNVPVSEVAFLYRIAQLRLGLEARALMGKLTRVAKRISDLGR